MAEKYVFIKNLEWFCLHANALQTISLHHLDYVDFRGEEFLYIFVGANGDAQKRVCISGDSNEAIVRDFMRFLAVWHESEYLTAGNLFEDLKGVNNG